MPKLPDWQTITAPDGTKLASYSVQGDLLHVVRADGKEKVVGASATGHNDTLARMVLKEPWP